MANTFLSDISSQKPNSKNTLLYGVQYSTTEASYIDFCRVLAENEDPKEYVCPGREDLEIERIEVKEAPKRQRCDPYEDKPQDSYAYMIYRALECSPEGKLTLSDIYTWIEQMYPFYRNADPVWKNSIRHNLSLNAAFKKIPRPESSKGKGGYWAIDHESQKNGKTLKRKRSVRVVESSHVSAILGDNSSKLIF